MDFLSAISSIPGLIADFSGKTSNPYGDQEKQLAGRMAQISAAQTDTSNPLYKQLYGQYQDQNRQSLAQTIAETQAQNRMATGMGRTPLLDPNRGGETIFRGLMQGYQGLNNTADQQTRAALGAGLQGANAAGNYYGSINNQAARAGAANVQGYQGIANILRGITGTESPYDPRNTTPNPNLPYGVMPPTSNYNPNPYGQTNSGWAGN